MPLHMQSHNQSSSNEVRSRKENRLHQPIDIAPVSSAPLVPDHKDMRRVSQQMFMPSGSFVPIGLAQQRIKSPRTASSEIKTQVPTSGLFGGDMTKATTQDTSSLDVVVDSAPSSDKGAKRVRYFTPASVQGLEDECDPNRGSPRLRLTPFAEDIPTQMTT